METSTARSPGRVLVLGPVALGVALLVVWPTFSWPLQGALFRLGVPGGLLRWGIGAVPDVLAAGLVGAGLVHAARTRQKPERLDWAAAAFVGLVGAYLLADRLALATGGDLFGDGPDGLSVQLVALRAAVVAPLLLLAVRSFSIPAATVERLLDVVQVAAVVLAVGGILEAIFPGTWNHVGIHVLRLFQLRREAYGTATPNDLVVYTGVGDRDLVRAGSFLLEYLQLGFALLAGLAIALVRAARTLRPAHVASVLVVAGGVLASQGRAAVACAAVAGVVVLVTRPAGAERSRMARLGAVAAVVVVALAITTGLVSRLISTTDHGDQSTSVHVNSTREALEILGDHPLGTGLGTGTAGSSRPHEGGNLISENAYLDIGIQVGVVSLVAFVVVVALLLVALWRRRDDGDVVVVALAAVVGLTLGGFVLHTWQMNETTFVVLALAAIALPRPSAPAG